MKLSRKEPVSLAVSLENRGDEEKRVSLQVVLDRQLSLSKGGFKTAALERIDRLRPREHRRFYFDIHAKPMAQPGEHPIQVRVQEHGATFQETRRSRKIEAALIVEA